MQRLIEKMHGNILRADSSAKKTPKTHTQKLNKKTKKTKNNNIHSEVDKILSKDLV